MSKVHIAFGATEGDAPAGSLVFPTVAALAAYDATSLDAGTPANDAQVLATWVLTLGTPPNLGEGVDPMEARVATTTSGPAKYWAREPIGHLQWATQAAWYVDAATGSDLNVGDAAHPLASLNEITRRCKGLKASNTNFELTIHVLSDLSTLANGLLDIALSDQVGLVLTGMESAGYTTPVTTGVVTAHTARDPVTGVAATVTAPVTWDPRYLYRSSGGLAFFADPTDAGGGKRTIPGDGTGIANGDTLSGYRIPRIAGDAGITIRGGAFGYAIVKGLSIEGPISAAGLNPLRFIQAESYRNSIAPPPTLLDVRSSQLARFQYAGPQVTTGDDMATLSAMAFIGTKFLFMNPLIAGGTWGGVVLSNGASLYANGAGSIVTIAGSGSLTVQDGATVFLSALLGATSNSYALWAPRANVVYENKAKLTATAGTANVWAIGADPATTATHGAWVNLPSAQAANGSIVATL